MKMPKNLLDERQQQELARMASLKSGLMFWITAVSLLVKGYALELPWQYWITELILLLAAGVPEIVWSVWSGVYDPYLKPTASGAALLSGASGLVVGGAKFIGLWGRRPDLHENWFWTIGVSSGLLAVIIFILCFFALIGYALLVKRGQRRREAEWEDG